MTSSATVVINVLDVNEPPFFLNSHYVALVSEHANVGEPIHAFVSAVDHDEASRDIYTSKYAPMLIVIGTKWTDTV